jgi:hypothetical protein
LLAADLVGDNAAADGASRIGAIQHTAVTAIKHDEVSIELAGEDQVC